MSNQVKQLTLSAFFLALGLVLPFAFHSFGPQAGTVFLPMHIPVLLCWHADTAAVECINRHAAAHADRNCHVFGAVDVWLFERMDDKKVAAVSFFNYHDAGRKGSQRTCQPGAAEHGTQGRYHADIFNCRLCYCDTRHCAAAGDDTASCECREKAGGQKSRGLMQSNRQFCCVCFHICRREECMRLGNRCAVFLFY